MAHEVVLPRLGWGMETGRLVEWLKKDGDEIKVGDLIFSVEGDKAVQDVEAMDSGILRIPPGSPGVGVEVPVGTLLAYLLAPGEASPAKLASSGNSVASPAIISKPVVSQPAAVERPSEIRSAGKEGLPAISPRARRIARELGVSWESLKGSGKTGRIIERDIRAVRIAPTPAVQAGKIRRITAERVATSAHTTAPVTLFSEVDATELVNLRKNMKSAPSLQDQIIPTYNDMLVKLATRALSEHPRVNAHLDGNAIVQIKEINIGVAVDTEAGLVVPVIHNADGKGLHQITLELAGLIEKARAGRLSIEEMSGGTFTITNLGMYDIDGFTPIINLPECAILGVGRIASKVVVIDEETDETAVRKRLLLSLTFDHRLVDGAPAARFLQRIKELVEHPAFWLF